MIMLLYTLFCSYFLQDNLYIDDHFNHCIRKVAISTSIVSTIAGTGGGSYSGDGGQATSATLYYPVGVAVDTSGNDINITKMIYL